ncbi:MAG: diacylglycerol kinase family protein [Ginsengibacter sp.]
MQSGSLNILFVINPASGSKKRIDWRPIIDNFFKPLSHHTHFYIMRGNDELSLIKREIEKINPDRVIAVGGDGTISLVGKILTNTKITMGILPGGSANGMAKELNISNKPEEALKTIVSNNLKCCDAIYINDEDICFHLSDLGLNARLIRYFDESKIRGMWNYFRMFGKAFINKKLMRASIHLDNQVIETPAYMIVIANASKYGTGAVINPGSRVGDGKFEVVVVKQIAFTEFIKLFWSYKSFDPQKVEIFETTKASIFLRRSTPFQVDGEYKGKVKEIKAAIIPGAVNVLV